jgi:hypothetical protein
MTIFAEFERIRMNENEHGIDAPAIITHREENDYNIKVVGCFYRKTGGGGMVHVTIKTTETGAEIYGLFGRTSLPKAPVGQHYVKTADAIKYHQTVSWESLDSQEFIVELCQTLLELQDDMYALEEYVENCIPILM